MNVGAGAFEGVHRLLVGNVHHTGAVDPRYDVAHPQPTVRGRRSARDQLRDVDGGVVTAGAGGGGGSYGRVTAGTVTDVTTGSSQR